MRLRAALRHVAVSNAIVMFFISPFPRQTQLLYVHNKLIEMVLWICIFYEKKRSINS